jgi:phosphate:Na+ symporter
VALKKNDKDLAERTQDMDLLVNQFYDNIKDYLTALAREPLGSKESKRCTEIISFATNLEHIGDIVSGDLIDNIVSKKVAFRGKMSLHDREDLNNLYQPVLEAFDLSLNVFTSGDVAMARQLLAKKYKFIKREKKAVLNHLEKIRDDAGYDSRLSAMQLDVLRDLKRINSHLTQVAYPILDAAGHLRKRLRREKPAERDDSRVAMPGKSSTSS